MEFGILFTSHPDPVREPYPHREVHARVTAEIELADRLGYDTAWVAEHHFSNDYGIMPDVFAYMAYLAARTSRIKLGAAVVTLPLHDPVRVVENTAFVDVLSRGRVVLGLGSGYRPYEFEGFGRDFEQRRDVQEEAVPLILQLFRTRRVDHAGPHVRARIEGRFEVFPVPVQQPHPPVFLAAGTDRSITFAARHGLGLMLSTLPSFDTLARQIDLYRQHLAGAPAALLDNPGCGHVNVARWVYVAESDAQARRDSEEGLLHHLGHFNAAATAGYLGSVSEKGQGETLGYDDIAPTTILHGSPATVTARLRRLREVTGLSSLLLHYPPYYGHDKAVRSLSLFAEHVIPALRAG